MPLYLFQHPVTEETVEVIQVMTEPHIFEKDGIKWKRIFTIPRASIDTKIGLHSSKDFVRCTAKRGMTIGQMMDLSAELSERRGGMTGLDPVRDKAEKDYEKKTGGKKHPHSKNKKRIIEI